MNDLTIRTAILRLMDATGLKSLVPVSSLEVGLTEIEADLMRVVLDVQVADSRGLTLSTAANDDVNYPYLNRFHSGLKDILTIELSPRVAEFARGLFERPDIIIGDELQIALGMAAVSPASPPTIRALARLLLFEMLRGALLLIDYLHKPVLSWCRSAR